MDLDLKPDYLRPYYEGYSKSCVVMLFVTVIMTCLLTFTATFAPYWLSVWRVPSTFHKLGLWWFCIYGYRDPRDYWGKVYAGCWWYFSPYLNGIRDQIAPVWFRVVQFCVTINIIVSMLAVVFLVYFYFSPRCRWALKSVGGLSVASTTLMSLGCIIFTFNGKNEGWMPQPDQNRYDWAFGFAGLSCFTSLFASVIAFVYLKWLDWMEERIEQHLLNIPKEPLPEGVESQSASSKSGKSKSLVAKCQVPPTPFAEVEPETQTTPLTLTPTSPLLPLGARPADVAREPTSNTEVDRLPDLEFEDTFSVPNI